MHRGCLRPDPRVSASLRRAGLSGSEPLSPCAGRLGRLRLLLLEAADQVGHVGHLLLEVALVLLERLQPLLAVREAAAPVAAAASSVSMFTCHAFTPSPDSWRSRNAEISSCVRPSASAQVASSSAPAGVRLYVRLAGPGRSALHSEVTRPSSSSPRRKR